MASLTFSSRLSSRSFCLAPSLALLRSSILRGGLLGGENSVSGVVFESVSILLEMMRTGIVDYRGRESRTGGRKIPESARSLCRASFCHDNSWWLPVVLVQLPTGNGTQT
jgi:hypothetical protein